MSNWQAIETAPTDGTIVLLYCPGGVSVSSRSTDIPMTFGFFGKGDEYSAGKSWRSIEEETEYHDYGGMTGVSVWSESVSVAPTHWMPLPAAPAEPAHR